MIERLLNSTVKPKPSLNLPNRIVCKRLEVLFHLWNAAKKYRVSMNYRYNFKNSP